MTPRGGPRPGAGRKPIDGEKRIKTAIWLPAALVRQLREQLPHGQRSAFIVEAIRSRLRRQNRSD